jgi:hypothetical protein
MSYAACSRPHARKRFLLQGALAPFFSSAGQLTITVIGTAAPSSSGCASRNRCGVTQIAAAAADLLARPPQGRGAVAQPILTRGAFRVLEDLSHRGLPHVEQGGSLEVA